MGRIRERLYNGIIRENPTFVLMLGMCPTLAVTGQAMNGLGMGLCTTAVLALSNAMISCLRKRIPDTVCMPSYIVIVATFVTVVQLLMQAYFKTLYDALGIYIPLIVVNCIILGRAEAYASRNPVIPSLFDGIGMGLGFTGALTLLGAFRELLGAGTVFGAQVLPESVPPIGILTMAPGAFFVLAFLVAVQNRLRQPKKGKPAKKEAKEGCGGCAACGLCGGDKKEETV